MSSAMPPPARGSLLVARPALLDPNFVRTVVLLCEHDPAQGSLGFVINRPTDRTVDAVLGGESDFAGRRDRLYVGGPVSLDSLAVIHRVREVAGSLEVLPGVCVGGSSAEIGRHLRENATAEADVRFVVGYSGWGEGQLEAELREEAWFVCPARPEWIFDPDPESLWRRVVRAEGRPWVGRGEIPVDPNLN